MTLEFTPSTLNTLDMVKQPETILRKYLRFDTTGVCTGNGVSCDNTLPEDATWCTDAEATAWQGATLINGVISIL